MADSKEPDFIGRDVVTISDFTNREIDTILDRAEEMLPYAKGEKVTTCLQGRIMSTLFFEPSTRTRLSHEVAMHRLGGGVIGFSGTEGTGVAKGETLADTIRMADGYCDIIVMRHYYEGAAKMAADFADAPVINGGDGAGHHPTQTLLDLFTIRQEFKDLEGLNIALIGDLKYGRTVHSLSQALARYNCNLYFVAPDDLQMPDHIVQEIDDSDIHIGFHNTLREVMDKAHVFYMTRIQRERFPDLKEYEKVAEVFKLQASMMESAKPESIVMHPLPRVHEIQPDVDNTKHSRYFKQAFNGVPVRMALLSLLLGVDLE